MKTLTLTALIALSFNASAQVSGNIGVVSDYKFRGISQTQGGPALQGLIEYNHKSGLYAGVAASNITWVKDATGSGSIETDLYFGHKNSFGDFTTDFGFISYLYPNKGDSIPGVFANPNTSEIYAQGAWKGLALKYSYVVSDHFVGFYNSHGGSTRGSGYIEANYTYDIGNGWSTGAHVGHQKVENLSIASYTDWKLNISKDTGLGVVGLSYMDTNASGSCDSHNGGTSAYCWKSGNSYKDVAEKRIVISYTYAF